MTLVDRAGWRDAVHTAIRDGFTTFVTLMAIDDAGIQVWLRLRNATGADLVLRVRADDPIDTITDSFPEAAWYEREAADMFSIAFTGHDTTPLLRTSGAHGWMRKERLLPARQATQWPGEKDPGGATARRRQLPPGVQP